MKLFFNSPPTTFAFGSSTLMGKRHDYFLDGKQDVAQFVKTEYLKYQRDI